LDDDFYNKLVDLYIKPETQFRETSAIGLGNETIDDYKREELKGEDSENSHDYTSENKQSSSEEGDEESEAIPEGSLNSSSFMYNQSLDSPKGPSKTKNFKKVLSKGTFTIVKKPF
jgi:hypothetical protein